MCVEYLIFQGQYLPCWRPFQTIIDKLCKQTTLDAQYQDQPINPDDDE